MPGHAGACRGMPGHAGACRGMGKFKRGLGPRGFGASQENSEERALRAAQSWVASADLPPLEGLGGSAEFAQMALQVYCQYFAGHGHQGHLFYRGPRGHEAQDFIEVFLKGAGTGEGTGLAGAVVKVAEQIDLQNLGYLDITQCLLLADGVLRWILTSDATWEEQACHCKLAVAGERVERVIGVSSGSRASVLWPAAFLEYGIWLNGSSQNLQRGLWSCGPTSPNRQEGSQEGQRRPM